MLARNPDTTNAQSVINMQSRIQNMRDMFLGLSEYIEGVIEGDFISLIVPGTPGTGKSFTVMRAIKEYDPEGQITRLIKCQITPQNLYTTLYDMRHPGCITILDDCDAVFAQAITLNILKAAAESSPVRRINWATSKPIHNDEGEPVPTKFEYEGSLIFLSNIDFQTEIEKNKGKPRGMHLQALVESRSIMYPIIMRDHWDYLARITQLYEDGALLQQLVDEDQEAIMLFIINNLHRFGDQSLRCIDKVVGIYKGCKRRDDMHMFEEKAIRMLRCK